MKKEWGGLDKKNQHGKTREAVRKCLKTYDPENDDELNLPEVEIKSNRRERDKRSEKWQRGPDKRTIDNDLA